MTETIARSIESEGPIPPQALDAERAVLAAMLLEHEAVGRAVEQIDASAFYRVAHQKIFDGIVALYNARNERADLITLSEELRRRGELEAVGGMTGLTQILEYATTTANLDQHVRIIREKAVLRRLIRASGRSSRSASPAPRRPPTSWIGPSSASSRSPTTACARASCP